MTDELVAQYTETICIPRRHTHPVNLRALIECASNYLCEQGGA